MRVGRIIWVRFKKFFFFKLKVDPQFFFFSSFCFMIFFGTAGRFYVYVTYGIYFCVNIVTDKSNWASVVLIRAIAMPTENEREAAGPGLLARRFGLNSSHDNQPSSIENGLWLAQRSSTASLDKIVITTRIGISKAKDLPWRWYLHKSRSVSKRAKGDHLPSAELAWTPSTREVP